MITITWFGTASILIEACGQKLLFDPFVELNGGSNPNTLEDFEGVGDIWIIFFSYRSWWKDRTPPYTVRPRQRARWRVFWRRTEILCSPGRGTAGS